MRNRVSLIVLLWLVPAIDAGMYSPEEKCLFRIRENGIAEELSFDENGFGQYKLELGRLGDIGTTPPRPAPLARKTVLDRINRLQADPARERAPEKLVALAVDYVRVRNLDAALNTLALKSRDRNPDFRILAALAHVHALRGEWSEAIQRHQVALYDCEFPKDLAGANPAQQKWLHRIEKEYYPRWLRLHRQEAERKTSPADEDLFPLFEGAPPADAVAIVQQLILWSPDDARLHWLLAELYASSGRLRQAEKLFDELAEGRQQSNRRKLMESRSQVKQAVATLATKTDEQLPLIDLPESKPPADLLTELGLTATKVIIVGSVTAAIVLVLIVLQVRVIRRRKSRELR